MPDGRWSLATLILISVGSHVFASHFRGAQITWKSLHGPGVPNNTVQITHRIAWRRSYSSSTMCERSTVTRGDIIGINDQLRCRMGCDDVVGTMTYQCTDFSVTEDWSAGEKTYNHTFQNSGVFEVSYAGGDWISLIEGGGNWEVRMRLNLTKRNDTGLVNSSPKTAMTPIVRLQHQCNHTITIPVNDPDHDEIRCRWAEASKSECAGVCRKFSGAVINPRECTITYSATRRAGWYAIALMIEDFDSPLSETPLSSVPLQFLVYVFTSTANCSSQPVFIGDTRADESCIGVPTGSTYFEKIVVKSGRATAWVIDITTVSPVGLEKSDLSVLSPMVWYVNTTWTPTANQIGPNIFCFTAIDNTGRLLRDASHYLEGVRILTLNIIPASAPQLVATTRKGHVVPPMFVSGRQFPTGLIYPNHTNWRIDVDQDFLRPDRSSFIRFHDSAGEVKYSIDVATTGTVMYPVGGFGRQLTFTTNFLFKEKQSYYITVDPGVVKGTTYCGAESPRIRDPSFWTFTIRDVTPPTVVFELSPSRSNAKVDITWKSDEETTYICTVQSPNSLSRNVKCNDTYRVTGILQEGYYSLFVQGTDTAANTARPVTHTWFVDLTPPVVTITDKPTKLSNDRSPRIYFSCNDEGCTYRCKFSGPGQSGNDVACASGYRLPGMLQNGQSYTFSVKAVDDVGNEGVYTSYTWQTDFDPPIMTSVAAAVVNCGDDYSPDTLGRPTVTDNMDTVRSLRVTVTDTPSAGCSVRRLWEAVDSAGNRASSVQTISFTSPRPPQIDAPASTVVACNQFPDSTQSTDDDITIDVTHPCNRSVTITHRDSVNIIRCGTTFTRSWVVTDDCGEVTRFQQTIQILALQYPHYPQIGQRNIELTQKLEWPQYPGATSYKLYVWSHNSTKPSSPTWTTTSRLYSPSSPYPPGTRMLWQVEYETPSATIPSPTWGFETQHYPDFVVASVTVPPKAFSGQSLSVKWQVKNIGGLGSETPTWYDAIYIGTTTLMSNARRVKVVRKTMFLDPDDGYSSVTDISLRNDDLGSYYIFVATNVHRNVREVNTKNNVLRSTTAVQVILTPPPNLIVETIQVSDSTYSGERFQVRWTVTNDGTGATVENSWRDSIYLSKDAILNTRFDTLLMSKTHTGFLSPGESYTEAESVICPNFLHGSYKIIVVTDVNNQVYEHSSDGDNRKVAENILMVTLNPPPDLTVDRLTVNRETFHTGDIVVIDYTIVNNGVGEPVERWWSDAVYLTQVPNGRRQQLSSTTFSGSLKYGKTYSRQVNYSVPVGLPTGDYNITVHTDSSNQVFEYQADSNNEETRTVRFIQVKADLRIEQVFVETKSNETAAYVSVVYSVKNLAVGPTFAAPWLDHVYIARSADRNDGTRVLISRFTRSKDLPASSVYSVNLKDIELPVSYHGNLYVHVHADYYGRVLEDDRANNIGISGDFTLVPVLSDLKPVGNEFKLMATGTVYGGQNVTVMWQVRNSGNRNIARKTWMDSIFLSASDVYDATALKMYDEKLSVDVIASGRYSVKVAFKFPENSFGSYSLLLVTDSTNDIVESDESNNVVALPLAISSLPSPDLTVTNIEFLLEQKSQFIKVTWITSNHGNSMKVTRSWCDDVILTRKKNVLSGLEVRRIGSKCFSVNLNALQKITNTESFLVPSGVEGKYWLHVVTDARKNVLEVNAETNNVAVAPHQVNIPSERSPRLVITFVRSVPSGIHAGESTAVDVLVANEDTRDVIATSWTDGLYFYSKSDAAFSEVMEKGLLIDTFVHKGGLQAGDSYSVKSDVQIPYTAPKTGRLYFVTDVNSRTGTPSSAYSGPVAVTIGNLPDLVPSFGTFQTPLKSGQPYDVQFSIENHGNGSISMASAYTALYLSRDVLIDPFDVKLKSRQTTLSINAKNGKQDVTSEVFIPYDLVSGSYYIIAKVDTRNEVYESDELNNEAHVLVTLKETSSTDVAISDVTLSAVSLQFNDDFNINWKVRNLGVLTAEGYKCDSIYFSEDDKWDIKDVQVETSRCRNIMLKPYVAGSLTDTTYNDGAFRLKTPHLAKREYKGLVQFRSNIRELNLTNNVGVSAIGVNITYPVINVGTKTTFTLSGNSEKSFFVPEVAPEETLVVSLRSLNGKGHHLMYLRHGGPASGYSYDAAAVTPLSPNQNLVAPNVQEGDHYLLVENTHTELSQVEVEVKVAKFEVMAAGPSKAAPIGQVTVKLDGTLFPEVLTATLLQRSLNGGPRNEIASSNVYRFSSTEVYATFDLRSAKVGQEYDVEVADVRMTSAVTKFEKALTVVNGIKGMLKVSGKLPRAMRPRETGSVVVDYRNSGQTDVRGGILLVSSTGIGELRLMDGGEPISSFASSHMILAAPMSGPAGMLSPQSYGRIHIQVRQKTAEIGRMPIKVSVVDGNEEPHPYVGEGERLKPSFLTDAAWEQTWKNCLEIVGQTWSSFSERLAQVGSQLSVAGRGVVTVETMFKYVLRVSDGAVTGDELVSFVDLRNGGGSQDMSLHVQRIYSQMITKRRTVGMFGIGWSSPLLEMKLLNHTSKAVSILYNREELVLIAESSGVYQDTSGNEAEVHGTELRFLEAATGRMFTFDIDSKQLRKIKSASLDEVTFEYTSSKMVKVKSVKDGEMSFFYNSDGFVRTVEIRDALRKMVEFSLYEYDPEKKNHLTSVTKGANSVHYTYTDRGDLERVVYANGRQLVMTYDGNYWLSEMSGYSMSGELMSSIQYKTDHNGKLTVTELPRQTTSNYLYDENLNLASMLGDDGVSIKYIRTRTGGQKILHGDQILLNDAFDLTTNIRSFKDGSRNQFQVEYDKDGQITNVTDGRGNRYQSTFKDGRLTSVIYPDQSIEKFVYDNKGKIVKQTARNGGHIEFSYDDKQHLIGKTTSTDRTFFTYSHHGYLSEAQNNAGVVEVKYNEVGLPTSVLLPGGQNLFYGYNRANQRTYLRDATGDYSITYHYNNKDQLVSVKQNGISVLKLDYDKGFQKKRTLGNGAFTEYLYNFKSGQLISLHNYHPNGTLVDKFEYEYDSRWRRVAMTTTKGTWKYRYDGASQLTHFEDPSGKVVLYRYDHSKNRISEQIGNKTMGYTVNSLNQYEGVGNVTYSYDKNGNIHQKIVAGIVQEVFVFDDSNKLIESQTETDRCKYTYDAMGNLYKKNCTAAGVTTFIVDPFGLHGIANVIGQISGAETTYFIHAEDQGLVAMLDHQGKQLYYQFDSQGSVTALMHSNGTVANSYSYDPFGKLLHVTETKKNDILFIGQWGVRREREVSGRYQMRARYYDPNLGRFMSPDPVGLPGPGLKNVNLYTYAENNPVTFADPQGRILPAVIAAGAAIGAITNGVIYAGTSLASGGFTWGGLGGAVVSGGITGAGITLGAAFSPVAGAGIAIGGGFVGGFTGSALQQGIDTQSFNAGDALTSGAWNGATAWLPWKMLGYNGKGGATAFGNHFAWRNLNFGQTFWRSFGRLGLKTPRALWSSLGVGNLIGYLAPFLPDWANDLWDCCLRDLWDDFLEWIRSRDPNDILGPAGYGDAHFIPVDLEMDYTIRFENDANATAPAQKVFIIYQLDSDLEIRTFKVGTFGFGNFTREIENGRPILQETIDLSDTRGIAVRVRAGIDIVNGLVTWNIQTLDPATGQPPTDPSVGFLPPNNGTSGQGFVTFSVSPRKSVTHLSVIDAEAKIIFDQNEPIDTPPIFNTIDSALPSANLTLVDDLVKAGTLAVNINKFDNGSGVRDVDIYNKLTNNTVEPLLTGVQTDVAVLPLKPGGVYQILIVPRDFAGNQAQFDLDDSLSYTMVEFPYVVVTCDDVNDCSGHGNCLQTNFCQCEQGYYGDDCSSDTPPPEPPLLEATSLAGTEDIPVVLSLSAKLVNSTQVSGDLSVEIYDIPNGVTFDIGQVMSQKVVLQQKEFGDVKMTTRSHFSGQIGLKVRAVLSRNGHKVFRGGVLTVDISPVADKPMVTHDKICFDPKSPEMSLTFVPRLQDRDGSEDLTVSLTGIPDNVTWSSKLERVANVSVVTGQKVEVTLTQKGTFSPFTLTLDVWSTEKANGDAAVESKQIKMEKCKLKEPTGSAPQVQVTNCTLILLLCLIARLVSLSSARTM